MYKYSAEGMYKSCFKKKRFRTYEKAQKVAKKWGQRVYFCPICGCFHLTSRLVKEDKDD